MRFVKKWYVVLGIFALYLLCFSSIGVVASGDVMDIPKEICQLFGQTYFLVSVQNGVGIYAKDALPDYLMQAVSELDLNASMNDFDKVQAIDAYLRQHLQYDKMSVDKDWKTYPYPFTDLCLQTGQAVCSGYADAFQSLCEALGIECWYVTGYAVDSDGEWAYHAWNRVVFSHSRSYYIDVCWNDISPGQYFLSQDLWNDHEVRKEQEQYRIRGDLFDDTGQLL